MKYYKVERERSDVGGRIITLALPQEPDAALVLYAHVASAFYAATNTTMLYRTSVALPAAGVAASRSPTEVAGSNDGKLHIQLPATVNSVQLGSSNRATKYHGYSAESTERQYVLGNGGISAQSAYDMIPDGPKRTSVERWVQNQNNWSTSDALLFDLQASIQTGKILGGAPIKIEVEVDFSDGSHADVLYSSEDQSCKYVPGSAYDSHGNHIPDKVSDLHGREFDFTGPGNPNDHFNWSNLLAAWDVEFGSSGGRGFHGWACTSGTDPTTGHTVYSCQLVR
ncbi:MAG TPA: hypothetical protein VFN13_11295 [Rudaea sp.]|nr:hypothetical protein [Rudaea sp.]